MGTRSYQTQPIPSTHKRCVQGLIFQQHFLNRSTGPTQADIRLKLAQQDMENMQKNGATLESHISPSAMIGMGIELEESKYVFFSLE